MSSASFPNPGQAGAQPQPRPAVVPPAPPEKTRPKIGGWLAAMAVVALGAGLYFGRETLFSKQRGGGGGGAQYAAATVAVGDLNRTIRLTGSVSAERFAAVLAPRLRGSRSGRGRQGGGGGSSSGSSSVASSGGGSSSSGSSSAASGASSGASATSSDASTSASGGSSGGTVSTNTANSTGTGATSLGALRGSTNRFSDRALTSSASRRSGSSSGSGTASNSMGPSGIGSTANDLRGTGGGGAGGAGGGGRGGGGMMMGGDFATVITYLIAPGTLAKKGEVVAEFDRQFQLNRIDDYKAAVVQAEANVRKLKADLAVSLGARNQQLRAAKADWDKALLDLKTLEVVSDMDAQRLKLAVQETEARYKQYLKEQKLFDASQRASLRISDIELEQAKLELQRAEMNAERMVVKAPMDGIVVMSTIRRGMEAAQIQQGDQIFPGQMLMQIVDPSSMVVNANVNQVDSEALRIGMRAMVRFDAYPGLELPAKIYSIGAVPVAGRRANFMKEIKVRLKMDGQDPRVIPDLSASAEVVMSTEQQATLAPLHSVFRDPAGKAFVLVRAGESWMRREVTLGLSSNLFVAVRSGLKPGEIVAAGEVGGAAEGEKDNPPKSPSI